MMFVFVTHIHRLQGIGVEVQKHGDPLLLSGEDSLTQSDTHRNRNSSYISNVRTSVTVHIGDLENHKLTKLWLPSAGC